MNRLTYRWLIIAFTAALLVVLNIRLRWEDGDEGRYVVLAQAIASGHGQTNIQLPEPTPEGIVPPGYLYALAGAMKIAGAGNISAFFWLSALFYLLFAAATARWLWTIEDLPERVRWCVWVIGVFGVINLSFAWRIHTEAMYFLVSLAALAVAQAQEKNGRWPGALLLGVLAAASALVRPVGIVLLPTGFAWLLMKRRWLGAGLFGAVVPVCYLPTIIRSLDIFGVPIAYLSMYGDKHGAAVPGTIKTVSVFLPYYFFNALPRHMFYFLFDGKCLLCKLHLGALAMPLCYATAALIAVGFFVRLRRPTLAEFYWILYWPLISTFNQPNYAARGQFLFQERYILPMIPLAALYLGTALMVLARKKQRIAQAGLALLALYVMATAVGAGVTRFRHEWSVRGRHPWDPERYWSTGWDYDQTWARYVEAGQWLKSNSPPDAVIVCRLSFHQYLIAGRKSARYDGVEIKNKDAWQIIEDQQRHGPVYVIQDAFPTNTGYGADRVAMLDRVLTNRFERFSLVHESGPPVTRIWKLK